MTSASTATTRPVPTADGVRLHLTDHGGDGPTVVLVHGYPDTSRVWDEVVDALRNRARVVTYDVRGAGRSDRPRPREAYRLDRLAEDLRTAIDAVSPGQPVHVVGHDWGAIQLFEAVCLPWAPDHIVSFTCISGASFDEAGRGFRRGLRRPSAVPGTLRRLSRSWYIGLFQLPVVPERTFRSGLGQRLLDSLEGLPPRDGHPADTAVEDAVAGLALYRANLGRVLRPQRERALVPTQVVVGRHDPFVATSLFTDLEAFAPGATVELLDGGHWLPRTHARELADLIDGWVTAHTAEVAA